jgi:flagellar basal-body rod protein FlgB
MDLTQFGLFDLAERRLSWADRRQQVLAQNIANADTPGYQAKDVPSVASLLSGAATASPVRTDPGHLAGTTGGLLQAVARHGDRGVDRNGVSMDHELSDVADTETTQEFATNIYKKYMSLFRLALGRSQ